MESNNNGDDTLNPSVNESLALSVAQPQNCSIQKSMDNDELNQAFIEPSRVNYTIGGSEQDYSSDDEKKKEELKSELIKRSHARRRGAMRDPVWRQRVLDDLRRSHDENKPSVECIVPGCK